MTHLRLQQAGNTAACSRMINCLPWFIDVMKSANTTAAAAATVG